MSQPTERLEWECPHCYGTGGDHNDRCPMGHTKTEPAAPLLHMNGSGYTNLYEQYSEARSAVSNAITKLCASGPNGRDYYPQPAGTMERAQDEHGTRVARLLAVSAELEFILMRIQDQEDTRTERKPR